jgi:predicted DCC family thiol-disulfide oxidoreductase YuxK
MSACLWTVLACLLGLTALLLGARRIWPQRLVDPPPVVFFDGYCALCSRSMEFLMRHDRAQVLRFSPLQGETARTLLGLQPEGDPDSVVLAMQGSVWHGSDAALRIAWQLGGVWRGLFVLRLVPRPVRDAVYGWVARNRFAWFGRKETCRLPTPSERARFLP